MDYSFGLLKPDCLNRGLCEEILPIIEAAGLKVIASKRVRLSKEEVDIIWSPCVKEAYYLEMLDFSTATDCLVFVVKGEDAITRLNELIGHYDPARAKPGTIRGRFVVSCMNNLIHSADDIVVFWQQVCLFFDVNFV